MKGIIILLVCVVVVVGIYYAFVPTMDKAEYPDHDAGVTGGLARGAVSRLDGPAPTPVYSECRRPGTPKDRKALTVGTLKIGETFAVLNHFRPGAPLWVQVQSKDNASLKGWIYSPPDDPIVATPLNAKPRR